MTNLAPLNDDISLHDLSKNPFPIYQRLRNETPVLKVTSTKRTLITKAADTKFVRDNPEIFSSNDPHTPMHRAFWAHTLMRKDGEAHMRERTAMSPTFGAKVTQNEWVPHYLKVAHEYVGRLPRGEVVDLFDVLSGPYAARGLAQLLGLSSATDANMIKWSQALINGAGNFGWDESIFDIADEANQQMNDLFDSLEEYHKNEPNNSALSVMLNADDPIPKQQMYANIKVAIGGGLNEPRDALNTVIYGLLTNLEQLEEVKRNEDWARAFEEGIRWIAPISASSRVATDDVEIRDCLIKKGDALLIVQASANRDEDFYVDGEAFNVYREKMPHQAFGHGPHFCQGVHVARRAIGKTILPILFDRFPNMRLVRDTSDMWDGFGFHALTTLPVLLE